MSEHAPGPWSYRPGKYDDWGTVRAPDGGLVCQARSGRFPPCTEGDEDEHRRNKTDPYEANARLIAAAPDLIAALLTSMCPAGGWNKIPAGTALTVENCVKAGACCCDSGAAVRKARGEAA